MDCNHANAKKFGKTSTGQQRFRCRDCGKTFTESTGTLGGMRIGMDKSEMIIRCLTEGVSVRATARLAGVDVYTVLDLLVLIGGRCKRFMEETIVGVPVKDVQADELWSFVYCKEKTRRKLSLPIKTFGDQYCFVGMERHHKLVLAWHLGCREFSEGRKFIQKLATACGRAPFQITTDGWSSYKSLIPGHLAGRAVDFAMLIKIYSSSSDDSSRYSPGTIIEVKQKRISGNPDMERACTSHVERGNLSIRMGLRRFTRLTTGFSRKIENHDAALALYFMNYNFVQRHGTLKTSPAVAAGIAGERWSIAEMIERTRDYSPAAKVPETFRDLWERLGEE